jgi:hypothetical protein
MTHGDKTKAKPVKSSKASGKDQASAKGGETRKAGAEKGNGKGAPPAKTGKVGESSAAAKAVSAGKASVGTARGKESGEKPRARATVPVSEGPVISNPALADSFDRAIKKYPNAFRKLTD